MRRVLTSILIAALSIANSIVPSKAETAQDGDHPTNGSNFDQLRVEGFDALYNLDYRTARERFSQMTRLAPEHPAGYVYLANNIWLEFLYRVRRLSTSLYAGESFYVQTGAEDKIDPKLDREFNDLIRQALAATKARLLKNAKDVEALYYQAAALGIRAAYGSSAKRSFTRAIGDANEAIQIQRQVVKLDPNYVDAYLSIGLYEYVIDSLPFGWRLLARFAGLKGSKAKGIEHLELVTTRGRYAADDARVLLLGVYNRENQPQRALEIISYLSNKYARNYLFGVERASMLYKMNRADEGARVFSDLLKDNRVAGDAIDFVNYQWGQALQNKQDYESAVARFKEVERWPKSDASLVSLAHLHAGEALDALGRRQEAMAEYQVVLKRENVFDSHKLAAQYAKKPYPAKSDS